MYRHSVTMPALTAQYLEMCFITQDQSHTSYQSLQNSMNQSFEIGIGTLVVNMDADVLLSLW